MENGILRSCALFGLAVFCVHATVSSIAAQQSQQTREGIITTFAPVVEKVAPSVVTVFTTQTLSRGQTAFSLALFSGTFLPRQKNFCLPSSQAPAQYPGH
jgi:S1-C subfamily serine protease